jgi:hypothetical protein
MSLFISIAGIDLRSGQANDKYSGIYLSDLSREVIVSFVIWVER